MELSDKFGYQISKLLNGYYIYGLNMENHRRFPSNFFMPQVLDNGDILQKISFSSLYDLHDYLTGNPVINQRIFKELSSSTNGYEFAGRNYEQAVAELIKDSCIPGYREFLRMQRGLEKCFSMPVSRYQTVKKLMGGYLSIPAYIAGDPFCYRSEEKIGEEKFIHVDAIIGYNKDTTKKQVVNRALIMANILKALEAAGYMVDLNTFEMAHTGNEYIQVDVKLKEFNEELDLQSLYKVMSQVEFLRRILFRVFETAGVYGYRWGLNYGDCLTEEKVKKLLNLEDGNLYFDEPSNMGIVGFDLADDFETAVDHLGLADRLDVEDAKSKFRQEVKRLSLTK